MTAMNTRSRARRAKQSDRRIGLLLICVGALLIVSLSGIVWWFKGLKVVLDPDTMCPKSGPYLVHAVIFDQSDPVSDQQALGIRQRINSIKDAARPGYRLDIYAFEGDTKSVLEPILSLCSPGRKEDANQLYQNPEDFRRRYDERFSPVLDKVVGELLQNKTRANSPIIESLKAASLWSFGPFESEKVKFRVTMISDMVQNTRNYSQFRSESKFSLLAQTPIWPSLRPNLKSAEVDIIYLLRPEAKRGAASVQNRVHQLFWEQLIRASGGHQQGLEPL